MRVDRSEIHDMVGEKPEMAQQMASEFTKLDNLWTSERMSAPPTTKRFMETNASAKEAGGR
jgi:hypothetical protein